MEVLLLENTQKQKSILNDFKYLLDQRYTLRLNADKGLNPEDLLAISHGGQDLIATQRKVVVFLRQANLLQISASMGYGQTIMMDHIHLIVIPLLLVVRLLPILWFLSSSIATFLMLLEFDFSGTSMQENAAKMVKVAWMSFPLGIFVTITTTALWCKNLNLADPYTNCTNSWFEGCGEMH